MKSFKICAISDTHNKHRRIEIPPCDILIHAGDATFHGDPIELEEFGEWLNEQDAGHIIFVPGNHEELMEKNLEKSIAILKRTCPAINILIHETITIEGIKIFGSPASPWFHSWAWNYARTNEEAALRRIPHISTIWDKIEPGTDIVITHGPVYRIRDLTPYGDEYCDAHVGCYHLMAKIVEIKPKLHLCGHIHYSYGSEITEDTSFYNLSICDERYNATNPPTIIDFELEK